MNNDAVHRLTAYLNQTRRQAEESIDLLNTRIEELRGELETSTAVSERLVEERDYFRNLSEQLKLENSKKWRLNERDDWKSLVESVQLDRTRLQQECARLEAELLRIQNIETRIGLGTGVENTPPPSGSGSKSSSSSGGSMHGNKENLSNVSSSADAGGDHVTSEERLQRELYTARRRIQQLEHALHSRVGGAGSARTTTTTAHAHSLMAAASSNCNSILNTAPSSISMTRARGGSTDSLMSDNSSISMDSATGRPKQKIRTERDTERLLRLQRKLAAQSSGSGGGGTSVWPLSMFFGNASTRAAPHEQKTTAGVLFV